MRSQGAKRLPGEPQTNDRCNRVRHASHGFYQNMIITTFDNTKKTLTKSNKLQVQRDMHLTIHNTTNINQLEFPLKISEQFQRWRRVRPNLPTGENSHCRWKNAMPPKAPVDKAKQKERDTRRQLQLISWVKLAKTPPKTNGWNRAKITPLKTNGWSHMLVFWRCIYNLGSGFNCFVTHTWGNDTTIWGVETAK